MSNNEQQSYAKNLHESEISLRDILRFLKTEWKTIAIFGLAGIGLSTAYLGIVPKQYEAVAQIIMAQIATSAQDSTYTRGANIEEPTLLIARMSSPASYPPNVIAACGLQDQKNAGLAPVQFVKYTIPKKVDNVVEIKTFGLTAQAAHDCANAIFELIKTRQENITSPYIQQAMIRLVENETRLDKAKELLAGVDKLQSGAAKGYPATGDEIRFLLGEISSLRTAIRSTQSLGTQLLNPIYAVDIPVSPKKYSVLVAGILGGLLLGLLIGLGRGMINKLKSEVG